MSTWTDEKHNDARVAAQWPETPHGIQELLSEAVDEIERLRAESARRMVWLEQEQRDHEKTRLALVDMTERAAHPEITDDRVERVAIQMCATERHADVWAILTESERDDFRADARAALDAAFTMDRAQRLYRSTRPKGFPMTAPVGDWLRDLLRLGRSARMHLVIAQQRPDSTLFDGSVRDFFGQRISLGEIPSRESALLQWNDARLARIDSHRAPGRGLVSFADEPTAFQAVAGIRPTTEPETLPHPALAPTGRQAGAAPRFSPLMPEDDEQLSWDEITGADLRAHTPDPAPQDGYRRCGQLHGFADWPQALAALAGSAQSTD